MNALLGLVLLALCVALQVTWVPHLQVSGAYPNLVLVLVVAVSALRGSGWALAMALLGGLALDLLQPGLVGIHALALCTAGYVTHQLQRRFEATAPLLVAAAVTATLTYTLMLVGLLHLFGAHSPVQLQTDRLLTVSLLNALALLVIWKPAQLILSRSPAEA